MAERESKPREPSPAFYGGYAYLPNTGSRLSSAGGAQTLRRRFEFRFSL